MSHVLEVVTFRLNDDADEAQFLKDAQATFDLLAGYEGYITRDLTVTEDGLWLDVVTWTSMDAALQAADQFLTSESSKAFGAHINEQSMTMYHSVPRISTRETVSG